MNRLMAARPIFRSMVQSNIAPVQRMSYHEDIGPPASYNQLPQPEGDWTENYQRKQRKYNLILAGSVAVFAATCIFIRETGAIFFNFSPPDTYE